MPVDRFTVMNDNFNNDSGISEWRDEEMPAKKMECKKIYIYIQAHKKKSIINALKKFLAKYIYIYT